MTLGLVDHLRISVTDRDRSKEFWSPVLAFMGYTLLSETEERVCYGFETGEGVRPRFLISQSPPEHQEQSFELGHPGLHHIAFQADSRQQVDGLYELLVHIGATTQGPPDTYDYSPGYYAVYFRDPDNLKFELVHVP